MNEELITSFKIVFSRWRYLALSLLSILVLFYAIAITYSSSIVKLSFTYDNSVAQKLSSIIIVPWLIFIENTTVSGKILAFTIIVLSGINIAMFAYYFRRRLITAKYTSTGLGGTILGLLGVGCASCGSILLSSIIGLGATTAILSVLPFQGIEIAVIGIFIILFSIYFLANKIKDPFVCKVGNKK